MPSARVIEFEVMSSQARMREKRPARRVTQRELARRTQSTQPRVAPLEQADASIEKPIGELLALGSDRKEIWELLGA